MWFAVGGYLLFVVVCNDNDYNHMILEFVCCCLLSSIAVSMLRNSIVSYLPLGSQLKWEASKTETEKRRRQTPQLYIG